MKEFIIDKIRIIIGENAKENTDLINKNKNIDHTFWFHLKDYPSPHLILFNDTSELNKETIIKCCNLVKLYSKKEYRYQRNIGINYTKLKNVITTKTPGLVQLKGDVNLKKI